MQAIFSIHYILDENSNENPGTGKTFPEGLWCAAFFSLEDAVEVRHVVEPTMIGDFTNGLRSVDQ